MWEDDLKRSDNISNSIVYSGGVAFLKAKVYQQCAGSCKEEEVQQAAETETERKIVCCCNY